MSRHRVLVSFIVLVMALHLILATTFVVPLQVNVLSLGGLVFMDPYIMGVIIANVGV